MPWMDYLRDPTLMRGVLALGAVLGMGMLVLIAIQMWRGSAIFCDGDIFPPSCPVGNLPTGAVIAFDRKNGCPDGWEVHADARGRFIVGVGRHSEHNSYGNKVAEKNIGDTGGENEIKLEIPHLPKHQHRNPSRGSNSNREVWALQATDKGEYGGNHARPTEIAGSDMPHENMPPYIAFHLCVNK